MCPEHQILSVYLDGELPSPWKEKMEDHLAGCPGCRKKLETYRAVSVPGAVKAAEKSLLESAKGRVWRNLEAGREKRVSPGQGTLRHGASIWRKRVSVPLPAAAAAALLVLLGAFWLARPAEEADARNTIIAAEADFETPGIIPVSDMNGVLQYLGNRDSGDFLILRLPESRNFMSSGEPTIMKAADYTRRKLQR
ncbi:MAG: zf-HC2 domain-containing protein [Treponema sp.]|jgi:anti-sigma factor RsiW|nr:zf-HC2 domain-containing protein [Treponema sp.]